MQVAGDVAATVVEYLPATHEIHVAELMAPRVAEYVPAPQLVTDEAPAKQ